MTHSGSCICGQITFEVEGPLGKAVGCHCTQCRKGSGHYVVATAAPVEAISISGTVAWYAYKPGTERGFCGTCGAQLFWRKRGEPSMSIMMGAFDRETDLTLAGHIYVGEKPGYYTLDETLPASAEGNGTFTNR